MRTLRDVSMALRPGTLAAVFGDRGAGKSTLLSIAAGIEPPDSGRVLLDGVDVATIGQRTRRFGRPRRDPAELRRRIVTVNRMAPEIPPLPMRAYVGLALAKGRSRRETDALAAAALERAGVPDVGDMTWAELSDAERTLVAFAHAIARRPQVMVVDDPVATLDTWHRELVGGLMRSVAEEEQCVVLVAANEAGGLSPHLHESYLLNRGRLLRAVADRPEDPQATVVELRTHRSG
nr:ABC transporter ATP-binding protein [Conexibacter arvalis]